MSRQTWVECVAAATQDGTAIANTTSESPVMPALTIPGNYIQDGRAFRVRIFGKLSTTGTPTIQFTLRLGGVPSGTLLAQTEAITNGSGVTNVNWSLEIYLIVRQNGSSGTVIAFGDATVQTNASGDPSTKSNVFGVSGSDAPATATVNLTSDLALQLGAVWSAASASNTLTGMFKTIESLN